MIIGYARVSTLEQNLDLQIDALKEHGCNKIFEEKVSSRKEVRKELENMLSILREGDTVVIWKLDRIARSMIDLINIFKTIEDKGASVKSINDPIDTSTPSGRLIFNIFGSLAEFERDIISERTKAGLKAARARGRIGGRPKGLSKESKIKANAAATLYREGHLSNSEICNQLGIRSKTTLYNYLKYKDINLAKANN